MLAITLLYIYLQYIIISLSLVAYRYMRQSASAHGACKLESSLTRASSCTCEDCLLQSESVIYVNFTYEKNIAQLSAD